MSVTTRYTLVCDDCGKSVDIGANPYARPDGWGTHTEWRGKKKDQPQVQHLCPGCAA